MKQWQSLMAAEEKRAGLPAGMLASLVQQETGGQQRFVDNPGDFHYKVGPNGEKPKSTARGLGGILEGTARDPGYGVTPLKDWSVPEQLRFMADYSKARIKQAGSVQGGLAGYGEGTKYGQQVAARMGKPTAPAKGVVAQAPAPVQVALAQAEQPVVQPLVQEATPPAIPSLAPEVNLYPQQQMAANPQWAELQNNMPSVITPQMLDYGNQAAAQALARPMQPNFSMFKGLSGLRGRA